MFSGRLLVSYSPLASSACARRRGARRDLGRAPSLRRRRIRVPCARRANFRRARGRWSSSTAGALRLRNGSKRLRRRERDAHAAWLRACVQAASAARFRASSVVANEEKGQRRRRGRCVPRRSSAAKAAERGAVARRCSGPGADGDLCCVRRYLRPSRTRGPRGVYSAPARRRSADTRSARDAPRGQSWRENTGAHEPVHKYQLECARLTD